MFTLVDQSCFFWLIRAFESVSWNLRLCSNYEILAGISDIKLSQWKLAIIGAPKPKPGPFLLAMISEALAKLGF